MIKFEFQRAHFGGNMKMSHCGTSGIEAERSIRSLMQVRDFEGLNQGGRGRDAGKNLKFDSFGKQK